MKTFKKIMSVALIALRFIIRLLSLEAPLD